MVAAQGTFSDGFQAPASRAGTSDPKLTRVELEALPDAHCLPASIARQQSSPTILAVSILLLHTSNHVRYVSSSLNNLAVFEMVPEKRTCDRLTPPSDNEGDSTMHSSADEDEMFPDEALSNNPATPMNASIQHLASASELSPPNSQGGPALPRDTSTLSGTVNANGKRPLSLAQQTAAMTAGAHTDADTGYSWTRQEDQPGWEWKNTRAREEESRALDSIVDQGAQIKRTYMSHESVWI